VKLPVIRGLAEDHSLEELHAAENAILEEEKPAFEVGGEDEGEQLTHLLGAIWIREQMADGMDFKAAFRAFAQRVRDSIS
jgi:hypothetical protein